MPVFYYDPPDRFIAGSVGQPGDRTFYLQATSVGRVTSVVLEKFQVSLLAERIDELLDEVLRRTEAADIPETAPAALLAYERLRRERVALVQRGARENGLRYDSSYADLGVRDAEIAAHAAFRRRLYDHDVVPEAQAAAMTL